MTNNQDARPFVDLKKDAQEFRLKFDEDIKQCLSFLDAKITTLICDPDSFGIQGRSIHHNALAEFSKAKYDIFIGMKSLINTKEREWLNYIAEMKKLFIENVEIFLAGTKLEVKLPPPESVSSYGPRKSPVNHKSNSASVTSSIYPILNTITKNISVLGSSFQEKDISHAISKANVGDKTQFNRRGKLSTSSIKLANYRYAEEEMDVEEAELDRSQSRSSSSNRSGKLSNSGLNTSQSNSERRNSLIKEINIGHLSVLENQTDIDVSESVNANKLPSKVRGRRGKLAEKKIFNDNNVVVNENNLPSKIRGRRGKLAKGNSSAENVNENNLPTKMRGRRGKLAEENSSAENVIAQNDGGTDDNGGQTTEMNENEVLLKGRRGRLASKAKDLTVVPQNSTSSTDENEGQKAEINKSESPLKGRRGRLLKAKTNDLIVEKDVNNKVHRGRSAASKNVSNISVQNVGQRTAGRGRRAVKPQIEEDIYEPGPSKSAKEIPFDASDSSSEELDIQTSLSRPTKSAARRKTLLPNYEAISGADIPGNRSRAKAKRKTISGVAELETVAPSKRLKISQKTICSQEEDSSANDNPLESDDNYSEWVALRSIDGKIPTRPAIYELKVWRAKKPAYIGSCESLRQKLTLYNLKQNSGHKHLDKFIDRNYDDIQVRYEVVSSFDDAKADVKNRIKSFVAQHKTTPAYN